MKKKIMLVYFAKELKLVKGLQSNTKQKLDQRPSHQIVWGFKKKKKKSVENIICINNLTYIHHNSAQFDKIHPNHTQLAHNLAYPE